jgi:hypothetical protein
MLVNMPMAVRETTREVPPKETRGSGTPVMGREAVTAPTFTSAWRAIQIVIPAATSIPNRSGALRAALIPR